MASSIVHRAMVYLGLVDDDEYDDPAYGEYGEYGGQTPVMRQRAAQPMGIQTHEPVVQTAGSVRTLGSMEESPRVTAVSARPAVVRPITPEKVSNVHVVLPDRFKDAQKIADNVKANQPVIVNLQNVDRDLSRRMIDFCSGVTYSLGGAMEKVADQVFLITPPSVEVTEEERIRLENGQYRS